MSGLTWYLCLGSGISSGQDLGRCANIETRTFCSGCRCKQSTLSFQTKKSRHLAIIATFLFYKPSVMASLPQYCSLCHGSFQQLHAMHGSQRLYIYIYIYNPDEPIRNLYIRNGAERIPQSEARILNL